MIKEIYKDIYSLEIILPNSPLKALNSYIIKGNDRVIVVDTGFNLEACKENLIEGLGEIGVKIEDTELLITHLHSDHSGLANMFNDLNCNIYTGSIDGQMINNMTEKPYWDKILDEKVLFGLEENEVKLEDHPGYKYALKKKIEFIPLREGDFLEVGDYKFRVMDIPGHTPGHIGLYEENNKLFFGGDHVLDPITPNIAFWGFEYDNILKTYMDNLKRVRDLDIDYLFPAHRKIIRNHRKRITDLLDHHDERLEEILKALGEESLSIREVSSRISWRIRSNSWEDFPASQKWFAAGEAMSHLEYLYKCGKVDRKQVDGILYYNKI